MGRGPHPTASSRMLQLMPSRRRAADAFATVVPLVWHAGAALPTPSRRSSWSRHRYGTQRPSSLGSGARPSVGSPSLGRLPTSLTLSGPPPRRRLRSSPCAPQERRVLCGGWWWPWSSPSRHSAIATMQVPLASLALSALQGPDRRAAAAMRADRFMRPRHAVAGATRAAMLAPPRLPFRSPARVAAPLRSAVRRPAAGLRIRPVRREPPRTPSCSRPFGPRGGPTRHELRGRATASHSKRACIAGSRRIGHRIGCGAALSRHRRDRAYRRSESPPSAASALAAATHPALRRAEASPRGGTRASSMDCECGIGMAAGRSAIDGGRHVARFVGARRLAHADGGVLCRFARQFDCEEKRRHRRKTRKHKLEGRYKKFTLDGLKQKQADERLTPRAHALLVPSTSGM